MVIIENLNEISSKNVQNADFAVNVVFRQHKPLTFAFGCNIIVQCIIMDFCTFSFGFSGVKRVRFSASKLVFTDF